MITRSPAKVLLIAIVVMWVVYGLQYFLPLQQFGIVPRTFSGLIGIVAAPFLHANLLHLITNTVSLVLLGMLFFTVQGKKSLTISIEIILIGGFLTWLIGRPDSVHIGASGYIYGLLGYALFIGIFQRKWSNILFSAVIFFLYGGALWGLLPVNPFVSWEGHVSGFVAGALCAKFAGQQQRTGTSS
ncbi:MAG: rhomboid family intramembrane serine protease [Gammaproteobacteria bacterium]|nr:rhomboid family intramembrane serine protease [Gammaproteobacteria bacterium]